MTVLNIIQKNKEKVQVSNMADCTCPLPLSELQTWCSETEVNPAHAVIVSGVPSDTSFADVEEVLKTVNVFGRVRVRAQKSLPTEDVLLCETRIRVDPSRAPPEIIPTTGESPCQLTLLMENAVKPDEFSTKLLQLLERAGKAMADIEPLLWQQRQVKPDDTSSIIRAVGDVLEKARPPQESNAFRRLRVFSGVNPTPASEETLDCWLEQAQLMLDDCDCSSKEKKKRIVESLKGPALEIIQAIRYNDPAATPQDYLAAIENVFGTSKSGEDLYLKFRSMQQKPNERLSDFVRRLEKVLTKAVQKGGLSHFLRDRARVEQLLRGAVESDIMFLQLRLKERLNKPPSFMTLLSEIRVEEDQKMTRQHTSSSVRHLAAADIKMKPSEIDNLKYQIQTLQSQVQQLTVRGASPQTRALATSAAHSDPDVHALQEQVLSLQHQLSWRDQPSKVPPAQERPKLNFSQKPNSIKEPAKMSKDSSEVFCYRCGEDGHIATNCANPENPSKVIRKLIQSMHKLQNSQKEATAGTSHSKRPGGQVTASQVGPPESSHIPTGLIGPPTVGRIIIEGKICELLMDSGSTVSIIFEEWYAKHLSHLPLHPISSLDLWGLGQNSYPYKGFITAQIQFPDDNTQSEPKTVLALVYPEPNGPKQLPIIIGTNARVFDHKPQPKSHSKNNKAQSTRVFTQSSTPAKSVLNNNDVVAQVRWAGPGPLTIPPGGELSAKCQIQSHWKTASS